MCVCVCVYAEGANSKCLPDTVDPGRLRAHSNFSLDIGNRNIVDRAPHTFHRRLELHLSPVYSKHRPLQSVNTLSNPI